MGDNSKKISLLGRLDEILSNNYVNTDVYEYEFSSIKELILNYVTIDVRDSIVKVTLHLDDFIIEVYKFEQKWESYSVPYEFIDNFHILLEE